MTIGEIHVGSVISGPLLPEPVEVLAVVALGDSIKGQTIQGLDGLISQAEAHLDRLNDRLGQRLLELERERHCTIADIVHIGRAGFCPTPNGPRLDSRPWSRTPTSSGSRWSS